MTDAVLRRGRRVGEGDERALLPLRRKPIHGPEGRVFQYGSSSGWWVRVFGATHVFPTSFPSKGAAMDMAKRNEIMVKKRGVTDADEAAILAALDPTSPKPATVKLSTALRRAGNAPPGGWSDADTVDVNEVQKTKQADGWVYLHGLTDKSFPVARARYSIISLDRSQSPSVDHLGNVDSFTAAKATANKLLPDKADRVEVWDDARGYMVAFKSVDEVVAGADVHAGPARGESKLEPIRQLAEFQPGQPPRVREARRRLARAVRTLVAEDAFRDEVEKTVGAILSLAPGVRTAKDLHAELTAQHLPFTVGMQNVRAAALSDPRVKRRTRWHGLTSVEVLPESVEEAQDVAMRAAQRLASILSGSAVNGNVVKLTRTSLSGAYQEMLKALETMGRLDRTPDRDFRLQGPDLPAAAGVRVRLDRGGATVFATFSSASAEGAGEYRPGVMGANRPMTEAATQADAQKAAIQAQRLLSRYGYSDVRVTGEVVSRRGPATGRIATYIVLRAHFTTPGDPRGSGGRNYLGPDALGSILYYAGVGGRSRDWADAAHLQIPGFTTRDTYKVRENPDLSTTHDVVVRAL